MIGLEDQKRLLEGIHDHEPVSGLTHNYYRYPARFSPLFARRVIEAFTKPGDLIYDPFMGGGTSLVEAAALGRTAIGTDISSLAVFIARVKTTLLTKQETENLRAWTHALIPALNIHAPAVRANEWAELGYQRNLSSRSTWRLRKLLEIAIARVSQLEITREQHFARCIVLKTAQWALDCRTKLPSVAQFRTELVENSMEMIKSAQEYAQTVHTAGVPTKPICLHRSAVGIEEDTAFPRNNPVSLVLTSPPYPGVHVLYHRWQVQWRKETPAPFWIASALDGAGSSFYTFGDRHQRDLSAYYDQALAAFRSIAKIATPATRVVQMVAFSDPSWQLPKYLDSMRQAGFEEIKMPALSNASDGRAWRSVPNRRWYASQRSEIGAGKEVVLFHRLHS